MTGQRSIMINPTYRSNWVIRDSLCVGACPTQSEADAIMDAGFTAFVCLQTPHEIDSYRCTYEVATRRYAFPIEDGRTPSERDAFRWAHMVWDLLYRGERVYMHCYGGHGRAGLMAALVLQISGMSVEEALDTVQRLHDTRVKCGNVASPTTASQLQMARDFMNRFKPRVCVHLTRIIAARERRRLPVGTRYVNDDEDPWLVLTNTNTHPSAFTRIIVA